MPGAERLDEETIGVVMAGLLAQNPTAPVCAIGFDGRFCSMPGEFPLGDHPLVVGTPFLDLVRSTDRASVLAAFGNARKLGAARVPVRLADQPDEPRALHFIDARHAYGVFIGILLASDHADGEQHGAASLLRPRLCSMMKDELGTITGVDDAAVRMLGWTEEQSVGKRSLDFVHPDDQERAIDSWLEMAGTSGQSSRWRGRYRCSDEEYVWIETTNINHLDDDHPYVLAELIDISEEMAAHEALRSNEVFLRRLTEALPVGVAEFSRAGRVSYANERLERVLGVGVDTFEQLHLCIAADDRNAFAAAVAGAWTSPEGADVEVRVDPTAGTEPITCSFTMRSSGPDALILCVTDVTERARLRRELEVLATYDELTGCHNRASTMRHLTSALASDQERGLGTGVVFVDLDDFKSVNDRYGHSVGDGLLRAVADRLSACARVGHDIVGRFGGDEFLVVFPGLRSNAGPDAMLHRVRAMLVGEAEIAGEWLPLSASVGGVVASPGMSLEELVAAADSSMYGVKRRHHGLDRVGRSD